VEGDGAGWRLELVQRCRRERRARPARCLVGLCARRTRQSGPRV